MLVPTLAPRYYNFASRYVSIDKLKGFVAAIMQEKCKLRRLWATGNSGSRGSAYKCILCVDILLDAGDVH
jgi:hypothetical protein